MYSLLGKYIRNKALKRYKPNKEASYKNLKDVSNIGFAYKVESPQSAVSLIEIIEGLKGLGIPYFGAVVQKKKGLIDIALDSKGLSAEYLNNITVLNKKDISIFMEPDDVVLQDFYSCSYDLFLNFNSMDYITLDCIVIGSKINYLVGMTNSNIIHNNMVLLGEGGAVLSNKDFFNQVLHYLKAIECGQTIECDE